MKRRFRVSWAPKSASMVVEIENPHLLEDWHTSQGFLEWIFGYAWNNYGDDKKRYSISRYPWAFDDQNKEFVWTGQVAAYPFTIHDLDLADYPSAVVPSAPPVSTGP